MQKKKTLFLHIGACLETVKIHLRISHNHFSSPENNIGKNSDLKIVRNYRVVRKTTTHIIQ